MPKVALYSIAKKRKDEFDVVNENYLKLISKYAVFKDEFIFNKKIEKAQKESEKSAKMAYSLALKPFMNTFSVVLDPSGESMTSEAFSKVLEKEDNIHFFIAGAYGFDEEIKKRANLVISLSFLTMSHKLARTMLLEQIYRGFTIINNHSYHK